MRRLIISAGCIVSSCWAAYGQTAPKPTFDVASIKLVDINSAKPAPREVGAEQFHSLDVVYRLIEWAYNFKPFQISGGPRWMKTDYYDVEAKAEIPSSPDQIRGMVQRLLEDRFQLKFHHETRETSVYALVVDKNGPRVQNAKDDKLCDGNGCFSISTGILNARGGTMALTVDVLTLLLDRPVVDKTGLSGHYDFKLAYDNSSVKPPRIGMTNEPTEGPSIFTAIQDLGLKLDPRKLPIEFFVIDSVEHPSEN